MLNENKALSSFSVNDIQKAKDFYGKTLGLDTQDVDKFIGMYVNELTLDYGTE